MTRYKLPDALGGHEVEDAEDMPGVGVIAVLGNVLVDVPGVGVISVPRTAVTVVTPPLPPEPPLGTLLRDKDGCVWERDDPTDSRAEHWFNGGGELVTWEKLWARGPLARMIPDPADMAPELPFFCEDLDTDEIEASICQANGSAAIGLQFGTAAVRVLAPTVAEQLAAAILRAVREARAAA